MLYCRVFYGIFWPGVSVWDRASWHFSLKQKRFSLTKRWNVFHCPSPLREKVLCGLCPVRVVTSVSAKELLAWVQFLPVKLSLQWFLCSSSPQDNQQVVFQGKKKSNYINLKQLTSKLSWWALLLSSRVWVPWEAPALALCCGQACEAALALLLEVTCPKPPAVIEKALEVLANVQLHCSHKCVGERIFPQESLIRYWTITALTPPCFCETLWCFTPEIPSALLFF